MRTMDNWTVVLGLAAIGNLANGLWMLADPAGWYINLPAAVPDTGPLNEHFVRDLGAAFSVMAVAFAIAAFQPRSRVVLVGMVTLFYVLHAAIHVYDVVRVAGGALYLSGVFVMFANVWLTVRQGSSELPAGVALPEPVVAGGR